MPSRRFIQLDVFTDRAGAGNALAVVLDGDGLDDEAMQRFAAWTNLSETTFLLAPTDPRADYRVRIFTPRQELPFAGHPSVGSARAALHAEIVQARDGMLVQECSAGLLPVRVGGNLERPRIAVRAPRARLRDVDAAEAAALDVVFDEATAGRRRVVDNGPVWLLVPMAAAADVRALQPDFAAIGAICASAGCVGLAVYAHAKAADHELVVRAFCPNDAIPEDPVTGSANAAIGAALLVDGELARSGNPYRASQGRELGRDGIVEVSIDSDGEAWIGGRCVIVIRGEVDWP
jgi:PhzF family phenazine biosynthesis protein